jgi:leader peptidase (prepilin peptidase) / N-methyltransferase
MTVLFFLYYFIFVLLLFLFGAVLASFLNVVIYRTAAECGLIKNKKGKVLELAPFWRGRSLTDCCQRQIEAGDNIPLISFLLLKGRCRYCQSKISKQHFISELIAGVYALFFAYLIYLQIGSGQLLNPITIAAQFLFFLVLIFVVIADFRYLIIPDFFIILLSILAVFLLWPSYLNALIALVVSFLFFTLLYFFASWIFKKEAMGLGDIKLMIPLSFVLGWPKVVLAIFLSFIVGGVFATILLLFKQKKIGQSLPFGPFLVMGFILSYFWAEPIWNWYLTLFL